MAGYKGVITPQGKARGEPNFLATTTRAGKCRRKNERKKRVLRNGEIGISHLGWAAETILV